MSIKVAQAVIRNNDEGNRVFALSEICEALNNGYQLCKVDEAIERLKFNTKDSERDYDLGVNYGLMIAAKIVKECCE